MLTRVRFVIVWAVSAERRVATGIGCGYCDREHLSSILRILSLE